jgi:hypothetical protein
MTQKALSLSVADFRRLAGERLRHEPPQLGDLISRPRGDHEQQPQPVNPPDERRAIQAAVLIPVVARAAG